MEQFYLYPTGETPVTPLSTILFKYEPTPTKIAKERRTADGTLKRDTITTKRTWVLSWSWLPTADNEFGLGAASLETLFYTSGEIVFREPDEVGSYRLHNTLPALDGFKKTRLLRKSTGEGPQYWDVSITLLEV